MAMTITEKILAAHAGLKQVAPGEIINCRVDVALGNDITAPLAIQAFKEMGARKVFDTSASSVFFLSFTKVLTSFSKGYIFLLSALA